MLSARLHERLCHKRHDVTWSADQFFSAQAHHGQRCDIFVNVPSISRWQWHPFSVANAVGFSLTLNIKRYGAFTDALMNTLQSGASIITSDVASYIPAILPFMF